VTLRVTIAMVINLSAAVMSSLVIVIRKATHVVVGAAISRAWMTVISVVARSRLSIAIQPAQFAVIVRVGLALMIRFAVEITAVMVTRPVVGNIAVRVPRLTLSVVLGRTMRVYAVANMLLAAMDGVGSTVYPEKLIMLMPAKAAPRVRHVLQTLASVICRMSYSTTTISLK